MTRSTVRSLALAALTLMASVGAQAVTGVSGSCSKSVGGLLDDIPSLVVTCPGGTWTDPRPGTTSIASWSASAAGGYLGASASAAVNTLPPLGQSAPLALGIGASGFAYQSDDLLFASPGLAAGTSAKMVFAMQINGTMAANNGSTDGNAASRADWFFRAYTDSNRRSLGSTSASSGVTNFYNWGFAGEPNVSELYSFELPVVLNQIVSFYLSLEARASASGWRAGLPGSAASFIPVQSSAASSFGNTASWQGITSLKLNDGTLLQDWTLSSASGFDYVSPVPEPGSWLMMTVGLAALGGVARRRARTSHHNVA